MANAISILLLQRGLNMNLHCSVCPVKGLSRCDRVFCAGET